jgi:hypothetical protein
LYDVLSFKEKLDALISSNNDIKISQKKKKKIVASINDKFSLLNKKVDLLERISTLSKENELLKSEVTTLMDKVQTLEINNSVFESKMISEFIDRNSRSYNIILFNLPKRTEFISNGRNAISDIMNAMNLNMLPLNLTLGKPSDKCRPLKLILPNLSDVFYILHSQSKLKTNPDLKKINFSSDRTILPREQMSKLRN